MAWPTLGQNANGRNGAAPHTAGSVFNFAEILAPQLDQLYQQESTSDNIAGISLNFIGANTVKLPEMMTSGFQTHSRDGGWKKGKVANDWTPYKLQWDRDIQFFVDFEDIDETNMVLSAANITNEFERSHGITEWDKVTYATIYKRVTADKDKGGVLAAPITYTGLSLTNGAMGLPALKEIYAKLTKMQKAGVNLSEVQMRGQVEIVNYLKGLKEGTINITGATATSAEDAIMLTSLRSMLMQITTVIGVSDDRLYTDYELDANGEILEGKTTIAKPAAGTTIKTVNGVELTSASSDLTVKKIQLMFTVPSAIARPLKRNKIYLKNESDTEGDEGDGFTYRQRKYWDVFVLKNKVQNIEFFVA